MQVRAKEMPLEGWCVEINIWGKWVEIESGLSRGQAMQRILIISGGKSELA